MTETRANGVRPSLAELQAIVSRLNASLSDGDTRRIVSLSQREIECLRILLEEAAAGWRT